MKKFQGTAQHTTEGIIGKITKQKIPFFKRKRYIFVCNSDSYQGLSGYSGLIFTKNLNSKEGIKIPSIYCNDERLIHELQNDDIVLLKNDGEITILWESGSDENSILLTEQCNCNCLMCPQPPRKDSGEQSAINKKILNLIDPKKTENLCITGGEPTILGKEFIETINVCKKKIPDAEITLLTNGTQFSNFDFTKEMTNVGLRKLVICVALYADTDTLHDTITCTQGSFYKTVKGIHNLAKFHHNIEIRYVVNKLNYERLHSFAIFIYRNFPFVIHVAFMGLEISGNAEKNFKAIWIDPCEYKENLRKAVLELNRRDIHTSIYNVPLCLIPDDIWSFSRKSISAWKNDYLPICKGCNVRELCCGIFTTSKFQSTNLKPIKHVDKLKNSIQSN